MALNAYVTLNVISNQSEVYFNYISSS